MDNSTDINYEVRSLFYRRDFNEPRLEELYSNGMPRDDEPALYKKLWLTGYTIDAVGVIIKDARPGVTGWVLGGCSQDEPVEVEVWLFRVRCKDVAAAYELVFKDGAWSGSINYVDCIPVDELEQQLLNLVPGIRYLSDSKGRTLEVEEGYGLYTREQITAMNLEAIESMAKKQKDTEEIEPFSRDKFRKVYPIVMSRTSIYNYVRNDDWPVLERMYAQRCRELRGES